jgi:hypothetical protein
VEVSRVEREIISD